MSLLRDVWVNFADRLFDREVVLRLDEHTRLFNEDGTLVSPYPDPHPQYLNLYTETAWAGLNITTGSPLIALGGVVAPYGIYLEPWQLTPDAPAGTITIPIGASGIYQLQWTVTFSVASPGGFYRFQLHVDGSPRELIAETTLSATTSSAQLVLTGLVSIDAVSAPVLDVRLDAGSARAVTIDHCLWSLYRLYPPLDGVQVDVRITEDGDNRITEDGDSRVTE